MIEVLNYGVLYYFIAQVTYVTLRIPLNVQVRSPTRPACTNLHVAQVHVLRFTLAHLLRK